MTMQKASEAGHTRIFGRTLQTLALAGLAILCACMTDGSLPYGLLPSSTARRLSASSLRPSGPSHVGWRDGVGPGRPWAVPMSLDYFQGFLIQVGVPASSLPVDGRALSPQQALGLVPLLLSTPVTLDNFAGRRMAAQLLLEVATGAVPVERETLHSRMRRFTELLVLRPDGYLVRPTTGEAVQRAGEVTLERDGVPRAGGFEVGPFYRVSGGQLFRADEHLEVPAGTRALGAYSPDDGVLLPAAQGAALAVVDSVEGLYRLAFHFGETLDGIAQLPGVARELYANAPALWDAFRHKPYAERVRTLSRLTTGALLVLGTSGAGAARAASWGGKLGQLSIPLLSLADEGTLALRLVVLPVGSAVAVGTTAVGATYVLHMATAAGQGAGSPPPPVTGPGQWVPKNESMSEEARRYQAQVTGAPPGMVYLVERDGVVGDFDGFNPNEGPRGVLIEAKGVGYAHFFDGNSKAKRFFTGAEKLINKARNQVRVANGIPIRWHVAEPQMVEILQKLFQTNEIIGIEVVSTPPLP